MISHPSIIHKRKGKIPATVYILLWVCLFSLFMHQAKAQSPTPEKLAQTQQQFVDLKFGMFIHFNIPTYADDDWPDPNRPAEIFNPKKLNCSQWAQAAKSAKMRFGCLTTKHHSGFCIWDTKTTNYNVMNSPFKRDVVREFTDAFRKEGLQTMLYYSILDTHHYLRAGCITPQHVELVKAQLTELLTNYGEIKVLIIDGWDAPWSRISYEDIPFEEIYRLVKRLQPNCLILDHNAAKYPAEMLFYSDIKTYEQNAGQLISKESNQLPALSCYPINTDWFWKTTFPTTPVKDPATLVHDNLEQLNKAHCNLILNVAPNRDGLIDDNAIAALKEIGKLWKDDAPSLPLPPHEAPIISPNLAKYQPASSNWSNNMWLPDFGNDDNFKTSWMAHEGIAQPWYEVRFSRQQPFNTVMIYDSRQCIRKYRLVYEQDGEWKTLLTGDNEKKIKIHRFDRIYGGKIKLIIDESTEPPAVGELGVYNEQR
jgi:alpha-L-fucosidase